jgi:hypothetical protein
MIHDRAVILPSLVDRSPTRMIVSPLLISISTNIPADRSLFTFAKKYPYDNRKDKLEGWCCVNSAQVVDPSEQMASIDVDYREHT